MSVEDLYVDYMSQTNSFKKEKILGKIIKCYEPLSNKLSYKYSNIFPSHEADDWKSLISLGIWEGLNKTPNKDLVRKYIYFRIKHQIAKEIQLITAMKQTYFHEIPFDLVSVYCEDRSDESDRITKIDIERAISKLPDKTKRIIKFWMAGLPICQDSPKIEYTRSSICDEMGLQQAAVYFRLEKAFELLHTHLTDYKD